MWTKPKTGGYTPNTDTEALNEGMDLRDYFAGQALAGLIRELETLDRYFEERNITTRDELTACVSEIAYDYADAMMQARSK